MITIHLKKYIAKCGVVEGKLLEENQSPSGSYTETKDTNNVTDIGACRQQFIEEIGRKIFNKNRNAEITAIRSRATTIEKIIIFNVT
jgi:hypothetical protein